jgi:glycosyltransferase involved in cell wall biosynthesis
VKVLALIDSLEVGGAETSLAAIFDRFEDTEVVVCHLYPGDRLRPRYEAAGVRVVSLDLAGRYAFRAAVRRVADLVAAERPDLLLSVLYRSGLVARWTARRTGLPLVDSFVNDSYTPVRYGGMPPLRRAKLLATQIFDRLTSRWATHFVAVSEHVAGTNRRALGVPAERTTVIYRGRDPEDYRPARPERRTALRRDLGLGEDERVILNTARLLDRKGQHELIAAMPEVVRAHPRAHLLIAGEGPERAALERAVADFGLDDRVTLLGTRQDVPDLLAAADLFVTPSHYEGHGGSLIEAMLAGLPIVATDTPPHRESIEPGVTGLAVPLRDPAALSAAIVRLLDHPERAREMGAAAREAARVRFDVAEIARLHEALYRRVTERHRGGGSP